MITTPNDISNCILWLDSHDRTTLFQDISVASTQRRNLFAISDNITSISRSNIWTTDTNWMRTITTSVSAPDNSSTTTWSVVDGFQFYNGSERGYTLYQYAPRTATYTLSFFVRNNGHRYIYFTFDGVTAYVDLNTGVVSGVTGGVTVQARPASTDFPSTPAAATGWYRVFLTKTLTGSVVPKELVIRMSTTNTSAGWTNRTNDPGKGYSIWGIMLEESGTLGSYIPSPTLETSFEDGTSVARRTVPISPVTANSQRVAYWRNKSLSADIVQLSGLQVFEENSDFRPTYTVSGSFSSLRFDYDYLSTPVLHAPINTSTQTVFAVIYKTWDNGLDVNRAFITQGLSGWSGIGSGGSRNTYAPIVMPYSYPSCSIVGPSAVCLFPASVSWLVRQPVQYNRVDNTAIWDNLYTTSIYRATKHANNTFTCAYNRIGNEYTYGEGPEIWNTGNRAGRYNNTALSSVSATDIFRLGDGINSVTTLEHGWQFYWPTQRRSGSNRGTFSNFYEVIIYNRELTKDEIDDVEDYLTRKWIPSPRQVWALSDGELSASNIFSISSEPTPFNVLLSSDIIYTNGYVLTATANQRINVITNMPTPVTGRSGGYVVMTEGVTLSAKVIGGNSPATVVVPPGVNCNINGNVFGGKSRYDTAIVRPASALNTPGVYIAPSGVLNLSGSSYGGFEVNSPGISTDGGRFDYTGIIEGNGFVSYSIYWSPQGSTRGFGASAINTNLIFNNRRIQSGIYTAGLFTDNCRVILNNCIVESTYNGQHPWYTTASNDRYGNAPVFGSVCFVCSTNTKLTATNTMFLGTTSTAVGYSTSPQSVVQGGSSHSGTALWALGSNVLLNNCYIEGSRRIAAQDTGGQLRNNYAGLNQAVRLSSGASLTGTNCVINGARNSTIDSESSIGKTGLYIDGGASAYFLDSTVNAEPITVFNRGIYNNGILSLSGNCIVRGGYRNVSTSYPGIYNRGSLYVEGLIAPNYSGSVAIDNESNGVAVLRGMIKPGGPICNTVTSRGLLSAYYSEPLISSTRGFLPIQAIHCAFVSLCSNSLYSLFSVDGVQQTMQYLDAGFSLNQPLSTDVLKDYVYGPLGSLTGVSIIPEVSATIIGVPVRSIYGSRRPLTVDAFWNQPITSVTTPTSAIYTKLINPVTSVALSAITQSLTDLPPPGI